VSDSLSQLGVSVEKISELILVTLRYSRYKQARVADATHRHSRRPLLFVEDLGIITPDVQSLRDRFQLPGTRVLQFAFDGHSDNPYLPHSFAYIGTHDNPPTREWYDELPDYLTRKVSWMVRFADDSAPRRREEGLMRRH
jgi:4-alpha-glucanotransferase